MWFLGLFGRSKRWRSLTPYVLTRHVKYRGPKNEKREVDGPEEQIRRELSLRYPNGPGLTRVTISKARDSIKPLRKATPRGSAPSILQVQAGRLERRRYVQFRIGV